MEFSELIKVSRKNCGLKLTELENLTGISASYISRIENGVNKSPSAEHAISLAEALNIPYEELAKSFLKDKESKISTNQKDMVLIKKGTNILIDISKNKLSIKEALEDLVGICTELEKQHIFIVAESKENKYRVRLPIYDDFLVRKIKELMKVQFQTENITVLEGRILEMDSCKKFELEEFLKGANEYFMTIDNKEYLEIKRYLNSIGY
ncbi:helix-turn-helix domain-containing protein [Clostridium perfringens]|uniref:helix-turn-helix domain-containing protein n=1 Tax=Clostridium perfringens TaxID=1502 RepID=UPI0018E41F10|nr:helix-turn-helix domain-containing protein [Clostridium perfringens]MBI5977657.1 helix-turn-helix domain-containing protein [Clostridium perfringens]MBI5980557.1 helix-turn-helix domain-containing protein [Clostridium perfringens]MDK0821271.1 helix-turn-helix domain-containing protein [Clostridium perfringens]